MAGPRWTPEEERDALVMDYAEWSAIHGKGRSEDSFRFKVARLERHRDRAEAAGLPPETIATPKPEPSEAEWDALFDALEQAEASRATLSPTEDTTTVDAPDGKPFAIAFMSDIHAGAQGVDYPRLRRDLETIRDTEGLYYIVNGDIVENAKHMMKSGNALYHSLFASPREQFAYAKSRLGIAQGKLLALLQGNHDARDGMVAGIDRLPDLARDLGVPYFTEKGGTIYLTVGSQEYVIVAKHEYAGNSRLNKSNRTRRMWDEWPHAWENADVVTVGHLHEPDLHVTMRKGRPVYWVQSGTYKTRDAWSESKGFLPSYGVPVLVFSGNERRIIPFADFDAGVTYLRTVRAEAEEKPEHKAAA